MTEVHKKIRLKRLELGFSQEYIGFKLGISQKSYCKLEKGETKLTVEMLFRVCEIIQIDPKEIL